MRITEDTGYRNQGKNYRNLDNQIHLHWSQENARVPEKILLEERIGHLILAFQKSKEEWSELFGLNFQFIYFDKRSVMQENVHCFHKHFHQSLDIMPSTF